MNKKGQLVLNILISSFLIVIVAAIVFNGFLSISVYNDAKDFCEDLEYNFVRDDSPLFLGHTNKFTCCKDEGNMEEGFKEVCSGFFKYDDLREK